MLYTRKLAIVPDSGYAYNLVQYLKKNKVRAYIETIRSDTWLGRVRDTAIAQRYALGYSKVSVDTSFTYKILVPHFKFNKAKALMESYEYVEH